METMPRRPEQKKLPAPQISEEQRQENRKRITELVASFKKDF